MGFKYWELRIRRMEGSETKISVNTPNQTNQTGENQTSKENLQKQIIQNKSESESETKSPMDKVNYII